MTLNVRKMWDVSRACGANMYVTTSWVGAGERGMMGWISSDGCNKGEFSAPVCFF